ncbi:MAG: PilZ domain-containing protein [Pontibacterium sp.]
MKPNKKLLRFLKQFFIQQPDSHHQDDGHLLSTQEFYHLLDKERIRADRLGSPFSLVIIPLPSEQQAPGQLRKIMSKIHANTRLIDELGWFAPGTLGLYLFNTALPGAQTLIDRVLDGFEHPELLDDAQIMVYPDTHPRGADLTADDGRRRQERIDLNLVATIQAVSESPSPKSDQSIKTRTRDISACCAYLLTDTPLAADTLLELEILLPYEELTPMNGKDITLKAVGHVVRADKGGVAIQFDKPQDLGGL